MRSLKWTTSHAVFVTEIDDQHKEIFEALSQVQKALAGADPPVELPQLTRVLVSSIVEHFAHEERLMRAARYESLRWHREKHSAAVRRVTQFVQKIEGGDAAAGLAMVAYLNSWLHEHTRLADQMLGAFLRNQERGMYKLTFQAGTKPKDSCTWVDSNGNAFNP